MPDMDAKFFDSPEVKRESLDQMVRDRVLFAVDPVATVVAEAEGLAADLVLTHHPLFLTPVHGVAVMPEANAAAPHRSGCVHRCRCLPPTRTPAVRRR